MATDTLNGRNIVFPIYNENGTPFHNLVLRKSVVDSIVMSLGDKITGDVYYKDNTLAVTMREYIEYKQNPEDENEEPIRYSLVNPPTIVREGVVADNGELKGMTKYSFEFYHPMCQLSNFPFTDVATKTGEEKYLSQNKTFSWIGNPQDYIDKLNKNLQGTVWCVRKSNRFPKEKNNELSEVQQFDKISIAEAIKRGYEIWDIPYVVSQLQSTDPLYAQGKRFVVEYGLPSNEIYESDSARQLDTPYVFQMGQGVGLKNNSRTPRNNKIITRISGSGSESNIPYGYPQIIWYGDQRWDYTEYEGSVINYDSEGKVTNTPKPTAYPIYKGIVGGQYVKLIKHPFTRTNLMPSIYSQTVFNKVSPYLSNGQANPSYSPAIEIKDYYDAIATQEYPYTNEINPQAPSYESHEFEDIKPEFDSSESMGIVSAIPLNADLTPADHWDDSMDDDGNYLQSYFQITLPQLSFDLYACAAITQEMQINMRSGACIGCTFPVQVDWDDYKDNFYDSDGNFVPDGEQRDLTKYPKSNLGQINVIVQKDNSTFGTLMPNIYQQPTANDLFVFIGISLPLSYITSAEERLDDAMKTYMLENNIYYFDYPLKFDEFFLATHQNILEQIHPNSIIHFMFGGVEQQLFVKQLTIKYGNSPLPQYNITLTDNIDVVLNQIGQTVEMFKTISGELDFMQRNVQTIQGDVDRKSKRGNINRFYYYAQEWEDDDEIVYVVNQLQAPYFKYQDEYWIFNPSKNGAYSMHDMGEPKESANGILGWEKMTAEFKYIITNIIFSRNAYLGSFIINGDWMISQHGTINGQESTNYTQFDPDHPNDNTGTNFIPNFAVDGMTGKAYQNDAYIRGEIQSASGKIGGFDIGEETLGTNYSSETVGGTTYIRNDGYMRLYNESSNNHYVALSVMGGFELLGNGVDWAVIDNQQNDTKKNGYLFIRANEVKINTDASPLNKVSIGGNNTDSVNINGNAANFGSRTPVSIGSTLAVSGLASLAGNIKTSSFTLPGSTDNPPKEGTAYLCKGILSDMTVYAPTGFSIMASDSRNTYQSLNFGDSSFIIVYMGSYNWVMFNCD